MPLHTGFSFHYGQELTTLNMTFKSVIFTSTPFLPSVWEHIFSSSCSTYEYQIIQVFIQVTIITNFSWRYITLMNHQYLYFYNTDTSLLIILGFNFGCNFWSFSGRLLDMRTYSNFYGIYFETPFLRVG